MSVKVILARHGEATSALENPNRPLSKRGIDEVGKMVRFLEPLQISVDEIRHSGKKRAEETAEILGGSVKSAKGIRAVSGMSPNDDVEPIADLLNAEGVSVMLVSHMPFLSYLTSFLILGHHDREIVNFLTASLAGLSKTPLGWRLDWLLHPHILK